MKVDRRALYSALVELVHVTDPKASLPILSHVLLRAVAGVLTLRATDLTRNLTCQLSAEGELETCLPAKLLAQLIKPEGRGDAGDVIIESIDDASCAVTFDGLTSRLAVMSPEMFPSGPRKDGEWSLLALWPASDVRTALQYVIPAASTDDGRPHLNAVYLDLEKIVTTDGHRLHLADLPGRLPDPLLIPLESAKTLGRISKLGDQLILARAGNVVRARVGAWQLDTKLADARFPPYEKVIPNERPTKMTVDRILLAKALARVSRLSKGKLVKLTINGQVSIAASDPDLGSVAIDVPLTETNHVGDDIVMGVNPAYLKDAISSKQKTIQLGLGNPADAMTLDLGEGRFAVVMPTRL